MPTATFYNLPAEKRERLLAAARAEFAQVPYEDASINRIIRAAGIPRGSFYMYFTDKEELFHYLMEEYGAMVEGEMAALLEAADGDLFQAMLALYDRILAHRQAGECGEMVRIFQRNHQMRPGALLTGDGMAGMAEHLKDKTDLARLDLQAPSDFSDLFHLLVSALAGTLLAAGRTGDPEGQRARLIRIFAILQRGAAAKAAQLG